MQALSLKRTRRRAAVEDLLAEIQEALVGARPMPDDRFASRRALLSDEIVRLGVAPLIEDLVRDPPHPDVASGFLDLTLDEPGRDASLRAWEALGHERLDALFAWMQGLDLASADATTRPWWSRDTPFPLHEDTLARLSNATGTPAPIGAIADAWARGDGIERTNEHPRREHNWRWLALGHGIGVAMPSLPTIIETLVVRLRRFDLLPVTHRVQVMRLPRRSSMVVPVRVPGRSILTLPTTTPTPLTLQYVVHELGHLAENALRPARASLRDRWSFDPVRSEGVAMLFELALRSSPHWLAAVGFDRDAQARIRRFLEEEERFTHGLIAATVALGDRMLAPFRRLRDGLDAAKELARALAIEWSPTLMLFRLPRLAYFRAIVAGCTWRDAAAAILAERFGPEWANEPRAWSAVRRALATTAPAGHTLDALARSA